jgi:hypothetical protein
LRSFRQFTLRGLAMLDQAFAAMRATQSMHFFSYHVGLLADARVKAAGMRTH